MLSYPFFLFSTKPRTSSVSVRLFLGLDLDHLRHHHRGRHLWYHQDLQGAVRPSTGPWAPPCGTERGRGSSETWTFEDFKLEWFIPDSSYVRLGGAGADPTCSIGLRETCPTPAWVAPPGRRYCVRGSCCRLCALRRWSRHESREFLKDNPVPSSMPMHLVCLTNFRPHDPSDGSFHTVALCRSAHAGSRRNPRNTFFVINRDNFATGESIGAAVGWGNESIGQTCHETDSFLGLVDGGFSCV